ncbi:uncharacterized protein [Littorina saxatilis]|uniref:Uncharacterized protein n=1 Tax=Littorina saxatilis TaxID=31220 RepID=A0AAN9BBB6_9CAEN
MKLLNIVSVVAALISVSLAEYDSTNDEELFDQIHNNECKSVALNDEWFQQVLTSDTPMGNHGRVYAFPPQMCPPGSVFSAAQCSCVQPGQEVARQFGRPSSVVAECSPLADISFDRDTGRYNSSTYVRYGEEQAKANLYDLTVDDASSSSGKALSLEGTPLVVQSFASNDLVGPWKSNLRVRVRSSNNGRTVLLSDDCDDDVDNQKSIELVLTGNTLGVYFRFVNDSMDSSCQVKTDSNGWYDIQMVSLGSTDITVTVNGAPCVTVDAGASLARTDCPVTLGAHPKVSADAFYGLIDFFRFVKNAEKCQ